jgi:CelD/BcsL family acetyltransferase involved in cellulose biosynthesis
MLTVERVVLDAVEGEWRDLCPPGPMGVFATPFWLNAWWPQFGGDRELLLLAAREEGRLVGLIPLMRDGDALSFAGDSRVCDYMDFPCTQGREGELLEGLFRSIGEEPWTELRLWAMPESSPSLAALPTVCSGLGFSFEAAAEDVCPALDLPGDWETYTASLDKKNRHELRRKLRKLPQAGAVDLEVLDKPDDVASALDDFLRMLRESRSDKAEFMTAEMEAFFRTLAVTLAGEGVAEMIFLRLGGVRAAGVLCFRAGDEVLLYNSGYDPAYSAYSVGLLSKALALQRAIEQGKKRFDFLRGHERYKYELGASDRTVYKATIARGNV